MGMTRFRTCAVLGMTLLQWSCVIPKAKIVDEPPVTKVSQPVIEPLSSSPVLAPVDDGLLMPNMLAMPSENDLRTIAPVKPKLGSEAGEVISRPQVEPSSEVVKPKE